MTVLKRDLLAAALSALVAVLGVGLWSWRASGEISFAGPDGAVINPTTAEPFSITAAAGRDLRQAVFVLNGNDAAGRTRLHDDRALFDASGLQDGDYTLRAVVRRPYPNSTVRHTWRFTVDTIPPALELELDDTEQVVMDDQPPTIRGSAEAGAQVSVDGAGVSTGSDGSFDHELPATPEAVGVVAEDAAGNRTKRSVEFTVVPSRVAVDKVRGVHVSFGAWVNDGLREQVLAMAERGQINTVQLDLKDESGRVGYDTSVARAVEIGADTGVYALDEAVRELHVRGIHVVGRIVAFRDGLVAKHAWANGQRAQVVQTPSGDLYTGGYEGFSNPGNEAVRGYNIDIAEEAAARGVDGILWDYVRRPDGSLSGLRFPGLEKEGDRAAAVSQAVIEFVRQAQQRLRRYRVDHGASVYGISAQRPDDVAQNVPALAAHLDYVAPMVYPSHWGPGQYGVADPPNQPAAIVERSLSDFIQTVDGTDTRIVPWLQDSPYRTSNVAASVRKQHQGARRAGIDEWLMWDTSASYTAEAYPERPEG